MAFEKGTMEWECEVCGNIYSTKEEAEYCCNEIEEDLDDL